MLVQAVKGHWKFVTSCALPMIGKSIVEGWRTGPLIREGEYAEAQELFDAARERGMSPFEGIFVDALERAVERVEALERRWWEE